MSVPDLSTYKFAASHEWANIHDGLATRGLAIDSFAPAWAVPGAVGDS